MNCPLGEVVFCELSRGVSSEHWRLEVVRCWCVTRGVTSGSTGRSGQPHKFLQCHSPGILNQVPLCFQMRTWAAHLLSLITRYACVNQPRWKCRWKAVGGGSLLSCPQYMGLAGFYTGMENRGWICTYFYNLFITNVVVCEWIPGAKVEEPSVHKEFLGMLVCCVLFCFLIFWTGRDESSAREGVAPESFGLFCLLLFSQVCVIRGKSLELGEVVWQARCWANVGRSRYADNSNLNFFLRCLRNTLLDYKLVIL